MGINGIQTAKVVKYVMKHLIKGVFKRCVLGFTGITFLIGPWNKQALHWSKNREWAQEGLSHTHCLALADGHAAVHPR